MKRAGIMMLAVLLLLPGIVFGEDAVSAADDTQAESFVFRDGITWGMSCAEVVSIEGDDYEVYLGLPDTIIYTEAKVSKFDNALLGYYFTDGTGMLAFAWYTLYDDPAGTYEYFKKGLSRKYGEEKEPDVQELNDLIVRAFSEETVAYYEYFQDAPVSRWNGPGETQIWLVWSEEVMVFYISPLVKALPLEEEIDITGM